MMKVLHACIVTAMIAALAVAEPAPDKSGAAKLSPSERQALILKRTGGYIQKPGAETKTLVVLDLQKTVPSGVAEGFSDYLSKNLSINTRREAGEGDYLAAINGKRAEKGNAAVLALVEKPGQPALLIAPEACWGMVNVAALKTAGCDDATLSRRVEKELWRAFGMVMGAGQSRSAECLLKPVFKPDDLDALKAKTLSVEAFNMDIIPYMSHLQLQLPPPVSYRKACEEGWAPAPTNELQKTVWDEVKGKK